MVVFDESLGGKRWFYLT